MLAALPPNLIFVAVMLGLLLLVLMASKANNSIMARVWGSAIGLAILIQLTL
jgi:hypothetical protein